MSLCHKRNAGPFPLGEVCEPVGQRGTVFKGSELATLARGQPVAELVDRPQVDAASVEREPVPVVEPDVLAEPVQEDDGNGRVGGGPVPVIDRAAFVIKEGHELYPMTRKGRLNDEASDDFK
jgi:hypothetical protein